CFAASGPAPLCGLLQSWLARFRSLEDGPPCCALGDGDHGVPVGGFRGRQFGPAGMERTHRSAASSGCYCRGRPPLAQGQRRALSAALRVAAESRRRSESPVRARRLAPDRAGKRSGGLGSAHRRLARYAVIRAPLLFSVPFLYNGLSQNTGCTPFTCEELPTVSTDRISEYLDQFSQTRTLMLDQ